jgi:hypothetical protein
LLALGEMGMETDTNQFKIGDGFTRWNSLPYGGLKGWTGNTGPTGATGNTGPAPTNVSTITINGTLTVQETQEVGNTKTGATGVVVHDWLTGAIFYHTGILGNFTCNLTNMPLTANRSYVVILILNQGASAYYASSIQINGVAQSMKWPNAFITPVNPNRIEIQALTLYYTGSVWIVLSQITSFG